jgi:hypothetical protein
MNNLKQLAILDSLEAARVKLAADLINRELYGVLNAVRVATKFDRPIRDLLPRIEEVLKNAEALAA